MGSYNRELFFELKDKKEPIVNRAGSGFILMDSGGVPENVTAENFTKIKNLFETAGLKHR